MHQAGSIVRYGASGICRVTGVEARDFAGQKADYYVLKPVGQEGSTLYVPCANEVLTARMQPLLNAEQINSIIGSMEEQNGMWIAEENKRREVYGHILRSGDRMAMARIIKTLLIKRRELAQQRKKLHAADEKLLKETERVLFEEFAYVLGIDENKVAAYILSKLDGEEDMHEKDHQCLCGTNAAV